MITAYTDGACRVSNPGQCSCAFVVFDDGVEIKRQGSFLGPEFHTNNYAEYQGLLKLLEWALLANIRKIRIHCDSLLIVKQTNGEWNAKPELAPYATRACALVMYGGHTLVHIRGHQGIVGNELADQICNEVLDAVKPREKKTHAVYETDDF
jgi:ribonuclease HI